MSYLDSRPFSPRTGHWLRLYNEGKGVRGSAVTAAPGWTPPFRPYVYRGTGADTLTAFMDELPGEPRGGGRPLDRPHGTAAAARRHYRRGEKPLWKHCEECSQWQHRDRADRYAAAKGTP